MNRAATLNALGGEAIRVGSALALEETVGEALEQWEVDMHVEEVRLDGRQTIGRGDQLLAEHRQLLQPFVEAEILQAVDADLYAQERVPNFWSPPSRATAQGRRFRLGM